MDMKWVFITGCDSGFGAIMVEKIKAMRGVGVFAGCYLADTVDTYNGLGRNDLFAIRIDVTDVESVEQASRTVQSLLGKGKLHGIVNNAGILINPGPTEWTPVEDYKKMFNVNVLGTVTVTKSFLPMIRKSQGRIVNVASIAGRMGLPSQPAYCASKYAVEGYSDVLRRDMLPWGVTVSIIEPGVFPNTGLYGTFQKGLDQLWEKLPAERKEEYGEAYYQEFRKRIGRALTGITSNKDSSIVPDAMLEALFSDSPKYRYRVGNDSKYLVIFLNLLHESTQDWVLSAGNTSNKSLPAAAPANGRQIATSRFASSWTRSVMALLMAVVGYRALRPRL